jgi:multidrug resistance efflux pump
MRFRFNLIYLVFLLGVAFFVPITKRIMSRPEEFYGIAENQVRSINLQYPVEVKEISVALGEKVDSGQLLARLYRTDLPIKLNDINYEIRELQVKRLLDTEHLQSEVRKLEAERAAKQVAYDQKISQLETDYAAQAKVLSQIKSLDLGSSKGSTAPDPHATRIESLKKEKALEIKQLDVDLAELRKQMDATQAPIDLRIKKLEGELELVRRQEADLEIYAPQSGIVGQLDYLPGDKLEAYSVIMRIYGTHSDLVTTYIGDGRLAEIKLGDVLTVSSINQPEYTVQGKVIGLGTRIRELPERLRRIPELKAWGREVQLQIPIDNSFLQGEKVKVAMKRAEGFFKVK